MLVTDDDKFASLAKHLSTTAKTDGLRYVHDQVGYNYRMVNILAALGYTQLKRISGTIDQKKKVFDQYKIELGKIGVSIVEESHNISNNWIVNVAFRSEADREKVLANLIENKIQARPLWTPAHRLNFMTGVNTLDQNFPNADDMWRRTLSLPSSAHLTFDQIVLVTGAIKESLA